MTTALVELMGANFNIPGYQRGYRWEEQEVTELLDDIWKFSKDNNLGNFYCLQPIVLQKNDKGGLDVLDGQQRLTTLYILLVYLEENRLQDGYNQPLFSLNYSTREKCQDFLLNKKFINNDLENSNIDFHHICKAYKCIDAWFKDKNHRGAKNKLVPILLDHTPSKKTLNIRNVRIIKYLLEDDTNPIDAFIRLNIGKIPLTDAELTKALLLQSDTYNANSNQGYENDNKHEQEMKFKKMKLYNIAKEWDDIEYALQDDGFWCFLNDGLDEKPTRIEFIFDLLAEKVLKEKKYFENKPLKHSTFLIFSSYLEDLIDNGVDNIPLTRIEAVSKIWDEVIEYYEYFIEWFHDRELYHFIGFLLAFQKQNLGERLYSLIGCSKKSTKSEFKNYLKNEIATIIKVDKPIVDLVYEDEKQRGLDQPAIRKILLIHNVYSTWKSDKEKSFFPFNLYKHGNKWSLEHIWAQNSKSITKIDQQTSWLDDHIKAFSNLSNIDSRLIEAMKALRDCPNRKQDEFEEIQNEVYLMANIETGNNYEGKHCINNMCLLDAATNSSLNNAIFVVKREKIKDRELEGHYIPICSRNAFLKTYTKYPKDNVYWTSEDKKAYLKSIEEAYDFFVKVNKN